MNYCSLTCNALKASTHYKISQWIPSIEIRSPLPKSQESLISMFFQSLIALPNRLLHERIISLIKFGKINNVI